MGDRRSEIGGTVIPSAASVIPSAASVIPSAARDLRPRHHLDRLPRFALRLLAVLLLAAPLAAQSSVPWLVGCWTTGRVNESWIRRPDGRLLGVGFTVFPDSLHRTETLELVAEHDELEYRARPEGAAAVTVFRAEVANGDSLVVTNPAHDFPQRIAYVRDGDTRMRARVEGVEQGRPRGFTLNFTRRASCPGTAEVGLLRIAPGNSVRVAAAAARVQGRLSVVTADSASVRVGERLRRVALSDITTVHRQRRSTLRGALIGGGLGGLALGGFVYWIVGAMCESVLGCDDDQWRGAAYGFGLGAVGGGLVGAGVGSLFPRWERVTP